MEILTTDTGDAEPVLHEPPSNTSPARSRILRKNALHPDSTAKSYTTGGSPSTSGSAFVNLKELANQLKTATKSKSNRVKNVTVKLNALLKSLKGARRTDASEVIRKIQQASPTPTATDSLSPPTPIDDVSTRGADSGQTESPSIIWSTCSTPSACQSSGKQLMPTTNDRLNSEIQSMINEIKAVASIKSTSRRIKSIAVSIIEVKKTNHRDNSLPDTRRWYDTTRQSWPSCFGS